VLDVATKGLSVVAEESPITGKSKKSGISNVVSKSKAVDSCRINYGIIIITFL